MKVITIANQKGGTGKSTTAAAIATGATFKGKKALAIDLDAQGNLSFIMGANTLDVGAYELMTGNGKGKAVVQTTKQGDVIASSLKLAAADSMLNGEKRLYALKEALKPLHSLYDIIVIDTPPTLGTLLLNALNTSDTVIIPLNADILSLQGLFQLNSTIEKMKSEYNKALKSVNVLFTKYSDRTVITREIAANMRAKCNELNINVFNTTIRESVSVKEAQTLRESIYEYAPKSKPTQDYLELLDELNI